MHVYKVRLTRERGRLVLQAMKHTPRDQSYISAQTVMDCLTVDDPSFKSELPLAMERLFDTSVGGG